MRNDDACFWTDEEALWPEDDEPDCADCGENIAGDGTCGCTRDMPPPTQEEMDALVARGMLYLTTLLAELRLLSPPEKEAPHA